MYMYCYALISCFFPKKLGNKHEVGAKLYIRYLDDTFRDNPLGPVLSIAIMSHDHNTGGIATCLVIWGECYSQIS